MKFINEKINDSNIKLLAYYSPACLEGNLVHALKAMEEVKKENFIRCKSYALNRLQTAFNFIETAKTKTKRIKQSKEDLKNLLEMFENVFGEKAILLDSKCFISNV